MKLQLITADSKSLNAFWTKISLVSAVQSPSTLLLRDAANQILLRRRSDPLAAISQLESTSLAASDLVNVECCEISDVRSEVTSKTHGIGVDRYFTRLQQRGTRFGRCLIYGKTVDSTQMFLDRNQKLLACLETGTVHFAWMQTLGRGRGTNSWVSNVGCLQFSLVLERQKLSPSIVFVQYLMALAVVEVLRGYHASTPVFIKWPNDIYAKFSATEMYKLGGILVNSSVRDTSATLILGCGLNVTNSQPSYSLLDVFKRTGEASKLPSMELILADVLHQFELIYAQFTVNEFGPFYERYYACWLHTDQSIKLEVDLGRTVEATIRGITEEGYLLAEDAQSVKYRLIPDGNTFDMFQGLIAKKLSR